MIARFFARFLPDFMLDLAATISHPMKGNVMMKRIAAHEPNDDLLAPEDVDSDVVALGEALLEKRAARIAHGAARIDLIRHRGVRHSPGLLNLFRHF